MTLGQALGLEADLNVILQSTADRAEGIASFLERRTPSFTQGSKHLLGFLLHKLAEADGSQGAVSIGLPQLRRTR